ncbi:hypothetical protein K450DRAFT_233804 [Umbelopsis ramanniana AG]|uniref:CBS domain-containing protein n=1 Tax=Umbelopsis ramanniana AG TaxID=1314678 RepID=A0AAD5EDL0_UMBRA|nr:uncharacterized protein K450DRAFT_233804 [Umbelopsis ramanniana AG]KAI8581239.1 hypothetical protein K450DRAFT_233804 [Umbelopsis ramanniana AG]
MSKSITTTTAKELGLSGVKKSLIVVQPTISIRDALEVMSRNGITSLPMYSHSSTQITSIVNLFDILIHLVKGSETASFDQEEFAKLAEPLENVLGLDGDMESYRVFKSYDTDDLIDTLQAFASGIHRSLVVDNMDVSPPWLLTQTDILRYVYQHPESLQPLGIDVKKSIGELQVLPPSASVVTASPDELAVNVYKKMGNLKVAGVPIVDENNKIISDLSIEDLPSADLTKPNNLALPCLKFLEELGKSKSLTVPKDITLNDLMQSLLTQRAHRAWIVSPENTLDGVISMSDIISYICRQHQAQVHN